MKNKYRLYVGLIFLFAGFSTSKVNACDVCGCGISIMQSGVMSRINSSFYGAGYQFNRFIHNNVEASMNGNSRVYEDRMHSLDLNYRTRFAKRWQLVFQLPLKFHQRMEDAGTSSINGLGDLSVMLNYEAIDHKWGNWKLGLWAGAGLVLPTGKYQQRDLHAQILPPNFQVGRGSYGLRPSLNFFIHNEHWGAQAESQMHFFSTNELGYSWGNTYNNSIQGFYMSNVGSIQFNLNLGMRWDIIEKDSLFSELEENTGGRVNYGILRFDIKYKQSIFSVQYLKPIKNVLPENQPYPTGLFSIQYFHEL